MTVTITDRAPEIGKRYTLGNRGDSNSTTVTFELPRYNGSLDLSTLNVYIEWKKQGEQNIIPIELNTDALTDDIITLEWLVPKEVLQTAGDGFMCVAFISDDENTVYRTDNIPIFVRDTIDVNDTIINESPTSYTEVINKVDGNSESISENKLSIEANAQAIIENANSISSKISSDLIGQANGIANLDDTGKIPSAQLPSYVDDVVEYASLSNFPTTGESSKIYLATDTERTYRWSGSQYIEISKSLEIGEVEGSAYDGASGKANAEAIATINERFILTDETTGLRYKQVFYVDNEVLGSRLELIEE